ncbi:MAG: efflux RND transporter periplasmic adaptor subunit [Sinimarinibacterium sp.]|jgi:Cu(I)/Ag(I) efflux system membrane fusion protein
MKKLIIGIVVLLAVAAGFGLGRSTRPAMTPTAPSAGREARTTAGPPEGAAAQAPSAGTVVVLGPEKVQKLGVRTARVERRKLVRTVRASGAIAVNETHHHTVAPKFEGWIEELHVNQTGAAIRRGQALAEIYSPELVSAQQEFTIATHALASLANSGGAERETMQALADAALRRLRNWDIPDRELETLRHGGAVRRTLAIVSPVDGVVLEKRAVEGMRFMPGEMLFDLADLSEVWLLADISAQDLADVRLGQAVRFTTPAQPGREFLGSVAFIYPTMTEATRTVKIRVVLPNADGALRPALFGQVEIATGSEEARVVVPHSAVLDSGARQTVLVAHAGGRFEPRAVQLGGRGDDVVEILDGVQEGEEVVIAANFLIDAESNLKSALGGLGGHSGHGAAAPQPESPPDEPSAAHAGHGK